MRYLYLLFFLLLGLHSHFVFADPISEPSCPGGSRTSTQICSVSAGQYCGAGGFVSNTNPQTCGNQTLGYGTSGFCYTNCSCRDGKTLQQGACKCPTGSNWDSEKTSCVPISCPEGQIPNTVFGTGSGTVTTCIDIPVDGGEECPNGRDPVTGQCSNNDLCPSGFPKVNGECPVCIGDYNEDGTCATPSSEPSASSSPDSGSAASGGSAGSAASTPSGGDDDGGNDGGGGGGGGDGNGGNNGGGGSAGSASSASGTGTSTGSNNSWNPYSGYGNWIPISEDSPCPNKYQDLSGQWWCAGGSTGGGSSSGNTGSSGSVGSAGSSAAGECDPTSRDYLQCISTGNSSAQSQSSQSSSAVSASSGAASSLGEKGEFDGEESEKKLEEIQEDLEKKIDDIKDEIQAEFSSAISGTGTIQDFCKNIRGSEVCFGMQKFESWLDPISQAIFLVACVLSFAIVLGGRN